jgi:hypothetical protein
MDFGREQKMTEARGEKSKKWLVLLDGENPRDSQRAVPSAEVASQARSILPLFSDKGQKELCESSSSLQGPANAPRPHWSYCSVR